MKIGQAKYLFFILILICWACKHTDKAREIPVNDFFKAQDRALYRLSPNGRFLSYLSMVDKKQQLLVENLDTKELSVISEPDERTIVFYAWVSDNELIFYKEKGSERFQTDLYIVNKSGQDKRLLISDGKNRVRLLDDRLIDSKYLLVTSNQRDSTVFDVYRMNVRDGKMTMSVKNPGSFTDWLTDNTGALRMAISNDGVYQSFWYRDNIHQPFRKIITNNFNTTLNAIAFSEQQPNIFYAISNIGRDQNALIAFDAHLGKEVDVLFANDTLNVVDAQYSKRRNRLDFVVYETWKKQKHFLSDDAKQLYGALEKLLPGAEIRIFNHDNAEKRFVIRTFTDRTPGSYYLYDKEKNSLRKLSDINPAIREDEMCEMKPISYLAADGLRISGYLTLPKGRAGERLPTVVMAHNGPGLRNEWGYNADVQFLANRGYAVLQVNYRGSSGYGKNFYDKGFKQWGKQINADIDAGTRWLINQKIADPSRIAIYGYGLGGFIAMNAAINNSGLYKCAASNSGVLNLFSFLKTVPPYYQASLDIFYELIGNPISDADYLRQVSPVFHANKVNIPVYISQSSKDSRMNGNDALQFAKELTKMGKPVVYYEKMEVKSSLDREEARKKSYASLEKFLSENLKRP